MLFFTFRKEVLLPKTPAARRQKKQTTTKRSRTLRSAAGRDSVDSGVELETKRTRHQLHVLTEKTNEEETTAAVTATDTKPATARTVAEARRKTEENRRKTEENKENIASEQIPGDGKQTAAEKELAEDNDRVVPPVSTSLSAAAGAVSSSSEVSTRALLFCFCDIPASVLCLVDLHGFGGELKMRIILSANVESGWNVFRCHISRTE